MSRTTSESERQQAIFCGLSPAAVAARLGVSTTQVYGYIADGDLPAEDVSRKGAKRKTYRVSEADLEAFRARRRTTNAAA